MGIRLDSIFIKSGTSPKLVLEREINWPNGLININIDVFKLNEIRDDHVYGCGRTINIGMQNTINLDNFPNLPQGCYKISSVRFIQENPTNQTEALNAPIHFYINEDDKDTINNTDKFSELVTEIYSKRQLSITTPISTPAAFLKTNPIEMVGLAFGEGVPIHSPQHMRGWSIIPYGSGMGYEDLRSAVNAFLTPTFGATIAHDPKVAEEVARRAPTFVIVIHRLKADNQSDALKWLEKYALDTHIILGVNKGEKPRLIATFVANNGRCEGGFYKDHYRGNLLAPINPGELTNQIEKWLPKMSNPRIRLLFQTYAEAMREPDRNFQYLRLWTLLELMAKRVITGQAQTITDINGVPILDRDGNKITTKKALPKVYQYLRNIGYGDTNNNHGVLSLWMILKAAYEIRNSVAHEGFFDLNQQAEPGSAKALAISYRKQPFDQIYDTLKSAVWISVLREVQ